MIDISSMIIRTLNVYLEIPIKRQSSKVYKKQNLNLKYKLKKMAGKDIPY
jgi:hypothetical protein